MSDNVGRAMTSSGVVENVGIAVGISVMSHSVSEKHCTSGLALNGEKEIPNYLL